MPSTLYPSTPRQSLQTQITDSVPALTPQDSQKIRYVRQIQPTPDENPN